MKPSTGPKRIVAPPNFYVLELSTEGPNIERADAFVYCRIGHIAAILEQEFCPSDPVRLAFAADLAVRHHERILLWLVRRGRPEEVVDLRPYIGVRWAGNGSLDFALRHNLTSMIIQGSVAIPLDNNELLAPLAERSLDAVPGLRFELSTPGLLGDMPPPLIRAGAETRISGGRELLASMQSRLRTGVQLRYGYNDLVADRPPRAGWLDPDRTGRCFMMVARSVYILEYSGMRGTDGASLWFAYGRHESIVACLEQMLLRDDWLEKNAIYLLDGAILVLWIIENGVVTQIIDLRRFVRLQIGTRNVDLSAKAQPDSCYEEISVERGKRKRPIAQITLNTSHLQDEIPLLNGRLLKRGEQLKLKFKKGVRAPPDCQLTRDCDRSGQWFLPEIAFGQNNWDELFEEHKFLDPEPPPRRRAARKPAVDTTQLLAGAISHPPATLTAYIELAWKMERSGDVARANLILALGYWRQKKLPGIARAKFKLAVAADPTCAEIETVRRALDLP